MSRRAWKGGLRALSVGLAVLAVSAFAIAYTKGGAHIAPFWPGNAFALTMLLRTASDRAATWLAVALGLLGANAFAGLAPTPALLFTAFNLCDVATSYLLVRQAPRFLLRPTGGSCDVTIMLAAACVGPVVGASLAAVFLAPVLGAAPGAFWMGWWLPSTLAILVITPVGLLVTPRDLERLKSRRAQAEAAACLLALALTMWLIAATGRLGFIGMATPVLMYAGGRFRALGAAVTLGLAAAVAVPLAGGMLAHVASPLWDRASFVLLVQGLLAVNGIAALVLAALLNERDGLHAALEARAADAAVRSDAKSRLLTHVSHEIRTPLNAILGLGERLSDRTVLDPRQQAYVEEMMAAADGLHTLAQDLLDHARIERGALSLAPAHLAPEPVLHSLVDAGMQAAGVSIDAPAEVRIWADPQRFRQIAQNLLSNALKYGGGFGPIVVSVRAMPETVRLEVSDCGPGFSPAEAHLAFEPFAIGGARSDRRSAGVGLSLVKALAEAHGGTVGLSSTPHVKTRVWIDFPHQPARPVERETAHAEPDPAEIFDADPLFTQR